MEEIVKDNQNQNQNQNTPSNQSENDCLRSEKIQTIETQTNHSQSKNLQPDQSHKNIPQNNKEENDENSESANTKNQSLSFKKSMPSYYNKNFGKTTIKADTELVDTIKQIAKDEARSIQTVTNRLLEKALDLYEEERSHYIK